jgi:MurNAc alpha-1-phosphate uridylyltransferase
MINTAMILAAGRGERMRPLTDSVPKPLLEVQGKALIVYHLQALKKAGYERVIINHAWLGEKLEAALGDGQKFGLSLIYSPEHLALETAGGIINALPLLCPHQDDQYFTVVNGDIFTDFDISKLPLAMIDKSAHLVMVNNPSHNPSGDFYYQNGLLNTESGQKLTFSGVARYHKDFFAGMGSQVRPLAPMLREAINKEQVEAQFFQGMWTDVGTPQRLAQLNSSEIG